MKSPYLDVSWVNLPVNTSAFYWIKITTWLTGAVDEARYVAVSRLRRVRIFIDTRARGKATVVVFANSCDEDGSVVTGSGVSGQATACVCVVPSTWSG